MLVHKSKLSANTVYLIYSGITSLSFGQIVGGPPVGYIGTAFSIRAALLASGALLSPVLLLYAYAARKTRGKLIHAS